MRFKAILYLTAVTTILIALAISARAQTQTQTLALTQLESVVPGIGQPFTVNGQTFLVTTNADGRLVVQTAGPAGSNTVVTPTTLADAASKAEAYVNANNPDNISYYSTNGEWDLSVGGVFAQNSGQAAAQLSIERYGVIPSWPNFSAGAAVLEGNSAGQSGTAAAYGFFDYRRPIGDVAFVIGAGGGYDNYNKSPMGIAKLEVEYRQNHHLGEYVGVGYAFEGLKTDRGLIIGGGIRYAF
jgi:hypothetical protein